MSVDEVVGYYTYRSFLDLPAGAVTDVLWGEAELLLLISDEGIVTGTLAFPVEAGAPQKAFLDLSGTVTSWSPFSLHFVATGRPQTAIADWEYEYDCRLAHEWETSTPPQRTALVGTVRRNKDHGQAKAGQTASFIAVQRDFIEPSAIPGVALIPEAVRMMSSRVHRLRHTVWHSLRLDWQSPKMTDRDRRALGDLGWYFTDPPFTPDGRLDLTNGAGEDFLYMHRHMVRMLHEAYAQAGQRAPSTWKELPPASAPQHAYREVDDPANPGLKIFVLDPDSSGFMIHPPDRDFMAQVQGSPFLRFNKTARGLSNLMRHVVGNLRNPRVLSQLTLGAYGNLIEFTVHNWMHMRWATLSRDPASGRLEVRGAYDVDPRWDDPKHDYLGDFHSSHVNPIFWKLHGWVDDCIEAWFAAHEAAHPGQVTRADVGGVSWFGQGPWVLKADPFAWPGAGREHGEHGDDGAEIEQLEKVMKLLAEVDARPEAPEAPPPPGPAPAPAPAPRPRMDTRLPGFARAELAVEPPR